MEEVAPLNLEHVFANCVSLIEWPIRLPEAICLPTERLELDIRILVPEQRLSTDGNIDAEGDVFDDQNPRYLSLSPYGARCKRKIQRIMDEGYFDDLLLINAAS